MPETERLCWRQARSCDCAPEQGRELYGQGPHALGAPEQSWGQLIPQGGWLGGTTLSGSPLHLLAAEFPPSASFKEPPAVRLAFSVKYQQHLDPRKFLPNKRTLQLLLTIILPYIKAKKMGRFLLQA